MVCNEDNSSCEPIDPECASQQDIGEWINHKVGSFININTQINFSNFENSTREVYEHLPGIPLENSATYEMSFRFRKNILYARDHWLPGAPQKVIPFYETRYLKSHRIPQPSH